jgi:hypothetical protein
MSCLLAVRDCLNESTCLLLTIYFKDWCTSVVGKGNLFVTPLIVMSLLTRREHAALTRDEAMNSRQISSRFRYLLFVQAINTNRRPEKTERRPLS